MIIKRRSRAQRVRDRLNAERNWHRVWRLWKRTSEHEISVCTYVMRRWDEGHWRYCSCAEFVRNKLTLERDARKANRIYNSAMS